MEKGKVSKIVHISKKKAVAIIEKVMYSPLLWRFMIFLWYVSCISFIIFLIYVCIVVSKLG